MNLDYNLLDQEERLVLAFRTLYSSCGYERYRMSKFEEYDLYSGNKDFLISENVITFNELNGKLMALKPDVTLSIVKNNPDIPAQCTKLYYDENVYRVKKGSGKFSEIRQMGLECMGNVQEGCICEVVELAVKSLAITGCDYALAVSNLDIIRKVLGRVTEEKSVQKALLKCLEEKNIHSMNTILAEKAIENSAADNLKQLTGLYGSFANVIDGLKQLSLAEEIQEEIRLLEAIGEHLQQKNIKFVNIDFSVADETSFYNGILFKGFVKGVPGSVLSGGQYDGLMKKMRKKSKAIGFAVYIDLFDRLGLEL